MFKLGGPMRILYAILLLCVSGIARNLLENDLSTIGFCCFGDCKPEPNQEDVIDSLVPSIFKSLPTVQEKLDHPKNKFTPVIGVVNHIEVVAHSSKWNAYSSRWDDNPVLCIFDDPDWRSNQSIVVSNVDNEIAEQFTAWDNWLDSTQSVLERRATLDQLHSFSDLRFIRDSREVLTQLIKVGIKATYSYDTNSRSWKEADTTVYLYLPVITTPYYVPAKNGIENSVDLLKSLIHIPRNSKRVFFGDGFSQQDSTNQPEELAPNQLKVLPYKYSFRIPRNPIPKLHQEIGHLIREKRFSEISKAMDKIINAADSTYPIFGSALTDEDYKWLNLLSGNGIRLTPYDTLKYRESHRSLQGVASRAISIPEIYSWLDSDGAYNDILKIEDDFSRIIALNEYAFKKRSSENQKEKMAALIEENLDKIPHQDLRHYLVKRYWNREEYGGYFFFGIGPALDFPLGGLSSYIDPGIGVSMFIGGGYKQFGAEFLMQIFPDKELKKRPEQISENTNDYIYDNFVIGLDLHYRYLNTKYWEADAYIGPTVNISRIINIDSNEKDWPVDQTSVGLDFGGTLSYFEPGHVFGLRLRLGASTENATKAFDTFSLKPYTALEIIVKYNAKNKVDFDWSKYGE